MDEAAGLPLDVAAYAAAPQELTQSTPPTGEAMDHIGIDVHKREIQICMLASRVVPHSKPIIREYNGPPAGQHRTGIEKTRDPG
jgi:hypothetical protein